jgi:signal transduction histidine kinase
MCVCWILDERATSVVPQAYCGYPRRLMKSLPPVPDDEQAQNQIKNQRRPSAASSHPSSAPSRRSDPPVHSPTLPASTSAPSAHVCPIPCAPAVPRINHEDDGIGTNTTTTHTSTAISPEVDARRTEILTVVSGPEEGRVYRLKLGENWIGRSEDCDIVILAKGVSRRHACITLARSHVVLRDNSAKNGTSVDDRRVSEHQLRPGEEIQLGSNASLLYSHARDLERHERRKAQSIASMVAGVAHQLNTPMGAANTANALIESLADELRAAPVSERVAELLGDLRQSAGLVSKNLERTNEVVRTFKQLSAREIVDDRQECDLAEIVTDCVDTVRKSIKQQDISIATHWASGAKFPWVGLPTSMYKVVEHLLQNSLRYGYGEGRRGVVDIRLKSAKGRYRLEVEDYGVGVAPEVLARMFEPFVTSDMGKAVGLGLAVVQTIVTTVFGGTITCNSTEGKGTRFIMIFPVVVGESEDV